MPLTLVTGRANTGKTGLLHDVVRQAAARGEIPLLVVPGTADARAARDEFARSSLVLGVRVATFDEFLRDLWQRFGAGRSIVTDPQRLVLLRHAIASCDLPAVGVSAGRSGFVSLMAQLAQLPPAPVKPGRESARDAAADVLRVLTVYRDLLERSELTEPAHVVSVLAGTVRSNWFDGPVVLNRFSDLTTAQERLICALAASGAEVVLSLVWERDFPATRALDDLVGRLIDCGAIERPVEPHRHTESEELVYLESHLFNDPARALGAPLLGDVRLSEACGEEAEADRIATEVLDAIAEGSDPSRIGVVFREPARHIRALARAFGEAGIQASYDALVSPDTTGWGRALLHLLGYALDGRRTDLVAFLRTPYSGMPRATSEQVERRWRGSRAAGPRLEADLRRSCRDAFALVQAARTLADAELDEASRERWQKLTDTLLRNAYGDRAPRLDKRGVSDVSAHGELGKILDDLCTVGGVRATVHDVIDSFRAARIPLDREGAEQAVQVLSARRARSRRFDVLIVGGLVDGDFPARISEDALSPRAIAAGLEEHGVVLRRPGEQDLERLLFYVVVTRATRRLVLSRQVADSEGKPLSPSWLLEEFLDLYRIPGDTDHAPTSIPPVRTLGFEDADIGSNGPPTRRRALRAAAQAGVDAVGSDEIASRLADARRRAGARSPGLEGQESLEFLALDRPYSATEIEAYIGCPYSWFHGRVVRARGIDERLDALAQGAIMHEALRTIYERLPERTGAKRVTPENVSDALELAAEVVDEVTSAHAAPATFAEEAAFVGVKRQVLGFVQADAEFLPSFEPLGLELAFGRDEPVLLGGFPLVGRIDRVDQGADGSLVVIDYKRSPTLPASFGQAKALGCGKIQLLLYARVAERAFGSPVVGAFYRGISARNVSCKNSRGFFEPSRVEGPGLVGTDRLSADGIERLLDDAEKAAERAIAGMRSGAIAPAPLSKDSCKYCDLRHVCPAVRS